MQVFNIKDMVGGWFVGDFTPSVLRTNQFEVGTKLHTKGSSWDIHTHKKIREITLVISGKMMIQDRIIEAGQIFILEPYEIANPEFLEDTLVVVVKTPSITGDKYPLIFENKITNE